MSSAPATRDRINLEGAVILLLDGSAMGMSILVQIVTGLGAKTVHRCESIEDAKGIVDRHTLDIAIVDAMPPGGDGYEFVRWLRTSASAPNRYAPVLVTTGHTPMKDVFRARDAGSNLLIRKPIVPAVMVERIFWASWEGRRFVLSDTYTGPDRRFRTQSPPNGIGRRYDDVDSFDIAISDRPTPGKSAGGSGAPA